MQEEKKDKLKIKELSEKLKETSASNRHLRQRNKELLVSRQGWKDKSQTYLSELRIVEKTLLSKKCSFNERLFQKPKGYQYSTMIICLAIWFRTYCNCSLRSSVKVLEVISKMLGLGLKIPRHTTIYNWECKLGYYRLEKKPIKKGKWSIIIDESITIAQQRILLFLGCNLDEYQFDGSLGFKDIVVLGMGVDKSWTELCIGQQIRQLQSKGYEFVNSISDGGKAIVKALKVNELNRIADCTHALGNLLERQYKKKEEFKRFSKLCGQLKTQLMNGSYPYLIPPKQRIKGRFLNLFELSTWGNCILKTFENNLHGELSEKVKEKLSEVLEYKDLIQQVFHQCETLKQLFNVLKTQGLSSDTKEKSEQILRQSQANDFFKDGVNKYLKENVKEGQSVICTSDIIESLFGKYKNRMSKNKISGFGLGCITLANMTQDFTLEETKKAMQSVQMNDLEIWKKENLYPNMLEKRRNWIKKCKKKFS